MPKARLLAPVFKIPVDNDWHVVIEQPNYTWRADKAHSLRQAIKRAALPVSIRIIGTTIEARWDRAA